MLAFLTNYTPLTTIYFLVSSQIFKIKYDKIKGNIVIVKIKGNIVIVENYLLTYSFVLLYVYCDPFLNRPAIHNLN